MEFNGIEPRPVLFEPGIQPTEPWYGNIFI